MSRASLHIERHGAVGIARHYIRDPVYGANGGIVAAAVYGAGALVAALVGDPIL